MKKLVLFALSLLFASSPVAPLRTLSFARESVEVTIYNQNFALIKDQRYLEFEKGINKIEFKDVAALIEPTSVHFVSVTSPASCNILEQNYEYDLVNAGKLLFKYIDKKIKVVTKEGDVYEGTLLSYDEGQLVIQTSNGLAMVARPDNIKQIAFDKLPEGLITKPTLIWLIESKSRNKQLTEVSYLTNGINWYCEYVTVLDKDDKNLDLDGWVSIDNRCGATYEDAKLKLIAGEVKRAQGEARYRDDRMVLAKESSAPQFEEKAFFEYRMYTLQRTTTLKDNQTKQVSLLNAAGVPIKKEFIFDPSKGGYRWRYYSDNNETLKEKIRVELEFVNSKNNNLGMPLPKGKVKVYKKDADGSLQFIGEDAIDHTPKDEKLRLYIGDAFDIIGERKRMAFKQEDKTFTEAYEITLRNHKEEDVDVIILEKMWRYTNWDIVSSSANWQKKDASTIEYIAKVPKNGEAKVTYMVKYWW